jgi:hypothetical protein
MVRFARKHSAVGVMPRVAQFFSSRLAFFFAASRETLLLMAEIK